MQPRQLKTLVATGHYKPEPSLVADAMLQRRGVRELLFFSALELSPAGRSPTSPTAGRRAA